MDHSGETRQKENVDLLDASAEKSQAWLKKKGSAHSKLNYLETPP
jgi:hypothetical protein